MLPRSSHRELPKSDNLGRVQQKLTFEIIERSDLLQYSLASSVNAVISVWHVATSYLGLIPPNSVTDKFPYYRSAAASKGAVTPIPREVDWVLQTQKLKAIKSREKYTATAAFREIEPTSQPLAPVLASQPALDFTWHRQLRQRPVGVRRGRRSYPRDALTKPGMIFLYNIGLAWALFQIDVNASAF